MRADRVLCAVLIASLLSPLAARADGEAPAAGTATVALEEILRLHRETEEAGRRPEKLPPPVRATIHKLEVTGHLLDVAIDLTVRFEVVVLADNEWVSVALLAQDPRTHLSSLPRVDKGFFSVEDGYLHFITRKQGIHAFEISLLQQAELDGRGRTVRLGFREAALATCSVTFDKGLFRLLGDEAIERSDGVLLLPEDDTFTIAWARREDAVEARKAALPAPAIESSVPAASASVVSTLEGRHVVRVRYELRFAGRKSIDIEVPPGLTLERAYLNGVSVPLEMEGTGLSIEVVPVREGDQSAVLELVLARSEGGYLLSGSFEVQLPRVSWPVHQLFLELHLPPVFNYTWSGGSLSPAQRAPTVRYTYELPLPGKSLTFHQHLISASAPNVTLDYAVNLEGHYYRPE